MTAWLTNRPTPLRDGISDPYWEAAANGRLVLQRCAACERVHFPPRVACPECWESSSLEWADASGDGVVHASSVVHRGPSPELNDGRPYVVALIELVEGVRMMSNVVDCDVDDVHVGMEVTVAFDDTPDGPIPVFTPRRAEDSP